MDERDSREKILQAAMTVFAEKGMFGAKMEEIAATAEINKAMLYYYFSTKDNLYRETLQSAVSGKITEIFKEVAPLMMTATDPVETLKYIIAAYFKMFSSDKTYTKLVLDGVANHPEEIGRAFGAVKASLNLQIPQVFIHFLEQGMEMQVFRRVDPQHLILNIIAMTLSYFFGAPAVKAMLDLHIADEQQFLQERQAAVIDLVLYGILAEKSE